MRDSHRSRHLRASVLVAAGAAFLTVFAAPATQAQDDTVTPGETVVGELVQAYADPAVAPESGHVHEDGEHQDGGHGAGLLSWVRTDDGDAVRVSTAELPPVEVGSTVEVTVGDEVVDEASEQGMEPAREVLATEVLAAPEEPVAASTTSTTTVNHPVTVVMLQPAGATRDGTTLAQVENAVNGSVADFWAEQTGGAVRLGTVAGFDWTTQSTTSCTDPFALWNEAAARAGWTSGPGKHLLVYVPAGSPGCSHGLGTIGNGLGSGGLAYVQAPGLAVIAHEFGHNFGLGHSSRRQCDGVVVGGPCQITGYDDMYDVMGIDWGPVGSLNAPQAALLGVLPTGTPSFSAGAATTRFTLSPVGSRTGTRAVRLVDADGVVYWLEYRTPTGRDSWLGTSTNWPGLQSGVQLRESTDALGDTSWLLDGTPSGQADWYSDAGVVIPQGTPVTFGRAPFAVTVLEATSSSAVVEVVAGDPVELAYQRLGGAAVLGAATTGKLCGLRDGGCFTHYERGSIYWSPATGARGVMHSPRDRWASLGWENGLGYPVTDTVCGLRGGGCFQHFQRGSLYATGAQARAYLTQGRTRDRWAASGWENGLLGYPVSDTVCGLRDGGCFQHFQGGSVYSSAGTGTRLIGTAVRQRWAATGWENGRLGYPVGDQVCGLPDSGCFVHFQGGSVYTSASTGAHDLVGPVRDRWAASGWERGPLGYPAGDTVCGIRGGGCFQHFQRGSVYWSPATGARLVDPATRGVWAASGWENGALGYPVTDQVCGLPDSGCFVHFQGGSVYTSASSGSHAVGGWVRDAWASLGWERGLGYPVEGRRFFTDGESQRFQSGTLRLDYRTGQVRRI
ncbi:hypothetical protein [Blastococcus sp. KM273129]|uniref:hypothetical protein n=1 Tax=Blastococcus sp. KM273129 TaxID=2570315 RepID=UPI001F23292A|nr:hypothetical protein [Blastococcus sp. KM273129]MCF6735331.1 hypothetical protein [Blastococcus sp. KM273129]